MAGRIETKHTEYHRVLDAANSATTALRTGGAGSSRISLAEGHNALNAAVVVTLGKRAYADLLGRTLQYINIPLSGKYVLKSIKETILDITAESFDNQSSPDGEPWAQLQESTEKWREWKGYPIGPPLVATGSLKNAVENWPRRRSDSNVVGVNTRMVISLDELGLDEEQAMKAYVHNIGGPWGWGGSEIPARPFMVDDMSQLSPANRARVKSAARQGFNNYMKVFEHPEQIKGRVK